MANETVQKTLSQEDQTVIANIKSMCEELLSMSGGGQPGTPAIGDQTLPDTSDNGAMAAAKALLEKTGYKISKAIESAGTESETQTGKKKTEETIENVLPEETRESVDEVAKAIAKYLGGGKSDVKKSSVDPILETIQKSLMPVVTAVRNQQETIEGILSATGILKQMEIAQKSEKKEPVYKSGPMLNPDSAALLNMFAEIANKGKQGENDPRAWQTVGNPGNFQSVNKSLTQDLGNGITPMHLLVGGGKVPQGVGNNQKVG